jgi:hypothetical protein
MIATISALVAFLSSMLPLVFKTATNWMDIKKEIKLKELEFALARQNLELQAQNINAQAKLADLIATLREGESLRQHDDSIDGHGFIGALRSLVRPLVTYALLGLWASVKFGALYQLIFMQGTPVLDALPLILDDNTNALIGAVFGFWFGGRMLEKRGWN